MKTILPAAFFLILAPLCEAFVIPMSFEAKCLKADVILRIKVEAVEQINLHKDLPGGFPALARCKVISAYKGGKFWQGGFIFIPCGYALDESPCAIESGKEYIAFLHALGDDTGYPKFGNPLSAFCCHEVKDGKANPEYFGEEFISIDEFAKKIRQTLEKEPSSATDKGRQ